MSDRRLGRRRALVVAGFWIAAALLIIGQFLWLRSLAPANRLAAMTDGRYVVPSGNWRIYGTLLPLLLAATALVLQYRWGSAGWRLVAAFGIFLFVPFALFAMLMVAIHGPQRFDSVRLATGQRYVMTSELAGLDPVYGLYESTGAAGLYWRRVTWLDSPDDGRFMGEPRLVVSPDERWLVAGRAGIWTDCFRLVRGRPIECGVEPNPISYQSDYVDEMHLRSRRIAALTGMMPQD